MGDDDIGGGIIGQARCGREIRSRVSPRFSSGG